MTKLGVFDDVQDALQTAYDAQKHLIRNYTTSDRDRFIDNIKRKFLEVIEEETIQEFNETHYGRLEHKLIKNRRSILAVDNTSALQTNVMSSSMGLTVEYAAPYGLIGAITPVTNGIATIACNSIMMIAAGNSVIFNVHPSGKEAGARAVHLINEAIIEEGGPENVVTMTKDPGMNTLQAIMASDKVKLLVGTGGMGMVKILMSSTKKVIAAGAGNPPVIVDETADITLAAQTLFQSVPFENNMLCVTEKEVFVMESVYDEFIEELQKEGARLLTEQEASKVETVALYRSDNGHYVANKELVGKDANVILKAAGVNTSDDDLRLVIVEASNDNPFVSAEQMMPVLPIVKVSDFEQAIEWAVQAEAENYHSAAIWSNDINRVTEFGKRINTSIFVQNGRTGAATGQGGTGKNSSTIATFTGEGLTTPQTFTRRRRFAMGNGGNYIV